MGMSNRLLACAALCLLGLAGCQNAVPVSNDDDYQTGRIVGRAASLANNGGGAAPAADAGILLYSNQAQGNRNPGTSAGADSALGVNAYLWRGALDTLSFMPLSSEDPFGGVIVTDWYSPPAAAGERFKATAYILGRELRADGVRVALFRQVLQNGQWVDAPVSTGTAGEMEDKILLRARELRAQSGG